VLCVATGRFDKETLKDAGPDYLLDDLSDTKSVLDILFRY